MKVGLYLPQIANASAERVTEVAQAAERTGYDSLWAFDHVVLREEQGSPYPYTEDGRLPVPASVDFVEALTLLTYAAAVTERVELGTAVLVLPMRAPVLHAKVIASLDHLAGGRFVLGAGSGWWKEEFEALSMPFDRRGRRMDEYIAVLRDLWTRDRGEFHGEFYDVRGWACFPKPARPIPIWLGGSNPAALRRAGRLADGWIANPAMIPELDRCLDQLREAAQAAGRDPGTLTLAMNRVTVIGRSRLSEAADDLARLRERGFDHVVAMLDAFDEAPIELIEAFSTRLPALR